MQKIICYKESFCSLGGVDYCTRSCQTTAIDQTGLIAFFMEFYTIFGT